MTRKTTPHFQNAKFYTRSVMLLCGLALFLAVISNHAFSQVQDSGPKEIGRPFITNYDPETYGANQQNWQIAQDAKGIVYFGNTEGLLSYDGVNWRLHRTPKNNIIRSLDVDEQGNIWIGGDSEIGYFKPNDTGELTYVDLASKVPEERKDFDDVWATKVTSQGVYFSSLNETFIWRNDSLYMLLPDSASFEVYLQLEHDFIKFDTDSGIFKLENNQYIQLPGSEKILTLGQVRPPIQIDPDKMLIGLRSGNLFIYENGALNSFNSEIEETLKLDGSLHVVVLLPNDRLAFGTTRSGVYITDLRGRILQHYDVSNGLQDKVVYGAFADHFGSLWLALDNGISRIETGSPFEYFDAGMGLTSNVLAIERYRGKLFVGTTEGASWLDQDAGVFKPVNGIGFQTFDLLQMNDELLSASQNGTQRIEGDRAVRLTEGIARDFNTLSMLQYSSNEDYLFVGSGILKVFKYLSPGKWELLGRIPNFNHDIWSIQEDGDGRLWLGSGSDGAYRLTFMDFPNLDSVEVEHFGVEHGLPDGQLLISKVGNDLYFTPYKGFYRFDESDKRFHPDSTFGTRAMLTGYRLFEESPEKVWISYLDGIGLASKNSSGTFDIETTPFSPLDGALIGAIYSDANGVAWIGTSKGLIKYKEDVPINFNSTFYTLIRELKVSGDSLLYGGNGRSAEQLHLDFANNDLTFSFAAPFYLKENKTQYQTWLEGFADAWSLWSTKTEKEYTNLPGGDYTFHVRARNIYGQIGEESTYSFTIRPPWYLSTAAILLYILAGIGLVWAIVRLRTGQLKRQRRLLEQTVDDRTSQLKQRVEELAVINSVQQGLVAEMDMQGIYNLVGDKVRDIFDAQIVSIAIFDHEKELEKFHYLFEEGEKHFPEPRPLDVLRKHLIKTAKPFIANRPDDPALIDLGIVNPKPVPGTKMPQTAVFMPLLVGDQVRGYISLQNLDRPFAFSGSDVNLLSTLSNSMSVALENARLFDETNRLLAISKQSEAEMSTVNNVSKALATQLDLETLIGMVGDQMRDLFKANIVYIALLDESREAINFPYQFGDDILPIKYGEGLTSRIIRSGETILINKDIDESYAKMGIERKGKEAASYLGVPIPVGGENIGVLSVQSTEQENRFDEDDKRLLATIATHVGVAMHNAKLFDQTLKSQAQAEEAQKLAEEANEAKSAFLSTVSHELRTPLTSVIGFAKIIRKRLTDKLFPLIETTDPRTQRTMEQVSQNLNVVVSEGERLTSLINDVLDLAKIEAGKMEWHMEKTDVGKVIEQAVAATSAVFESKSLRLSSKINGELPLITCDRDKLIQVLINLLSNAGKFTDKGSVTVSASQLDDEIVVSVKDTGMGISEEDRHKVFEKFKQVGDTLTDKPKGTGLGLPICKEIIEYHGGRIWLESTMGKGSTFSFSIPVEGTAESSSALHLDDLVKQLKEQVLNTANPRGEGVEQTILVVDDEAPIRDLLRQELTESGYRVREAANGKDALDEIRKERPDLVILDIMMPEMNGFDVAAVLKNDPATMDIPILVLSIVQDKERGYRLGVDRYLTKPIDTDALFKEVGNLLEQGKSRKKVMIVDENSSTVRTLAEVLETRGYQVVESNGMELIQKAVDSKPDIIILNSVLSGNKDAIKTLRFEKGLENVLFLMYQ